MSNDLLRAHLKAIHDRRGQLDPADVVDEARPADHPLHGYFLWDDEAAAEAYRVDQARRLIRRVKYVYQEEPQEPARKVRYFLNVDPHGEQVSRTYRPITDVAQDSEARAFVLSEARRDLERLQRKYAHLGEAFNELLREAVGVDAA